MSVEKASFRLSVFLGFAYTMYVIGKMSFSAATVGLIEEEILTKTQTGIISGIFWLVYAVGQVIGALIVNKVSAYLLIEIGIVGSALSNVLMASTENFVILLLVWCLGGAAQLGLWSGLLKLTSTEVLEKHKPMLVGFLAYSYSIGSIISYFLTAAILAVSSWKYIFVLCGVICGLALPGIVYSHINASPVLEKEMGEQSNITRHRQKITWKIIWNRGLIFFSLLMCVKTIVENGIGSWMPTILFEVYGISSSYSSLLSVGRLVVALFGVALGAFVYAKARTDELHSLIIIVLPMLPIVLLLNNLPNIGVTTVIVLLFAGALLLSATTPRISLNYPARYQDIGLTANVGAIINCMSTGGMAIATYGGGYVADHFGWNAVVHMWTILIAVFLVIAIGMIPVWNRFKRSWGIKSS